MENVKQKIKTALSRRQKVIMERKGDAAAAVLVPLFCIHGELYILFTRRTETVRHHKREISFPGGAFQKEDRNLAETALRETAEEIGLETDAIELVGELDGVHTRASSYNVAPFVAFIRYPYPFKLNTEEASEIIEVPVSALMDEACRSEQVDVVDGREEVNYRYHYKGVIIHGATARMLHLLLDIVAPLL